MTTPPIPPATPQGPGEPERLATPETAGEPANVWAAPTGLPAQPPTHAAGSPPAGWPAPPTQPPVAPSVPSKPASRVGLVIASVLGVLLLGMMSFVLYWFSKDGGLDTATSTTPSPTVTTSALPQAKVGDCAKVSGASFNIKYEPVPCEGGLHNYTVSKVLGSQSEKCGEDRDSYTKYHGYSGRKSVNLCLIPVFTDGQCYSFTTASFDAEFQTAPCGGLQVVKVKVLTDTVDKAACGESPALALAYPEIKTTYCFTDTYGR
ncbi:LppU/SCO3897 family protein [Lentzea aerocolonigenes]|uniref:LppU/SCO3897 family protein n=1 Tax=Lentzea aerocolonigenes TaxID=68170 RepID=UPI000AE54207|nr:hypothetical protein [Lentzea aerocolonigenes]MCP2242837.1 hypothetical protein [Lentzea aerocolonigenes]